MVISSSKGNWMSRAMFELKRHYALYLMCLVPVGLIILFHYVPMYGIQIAFKDYKVLTGFADSKWVGLKFFRKFLSFSQAGDIVLNTLVISFYAILTSPCSLILAIMLNYLPFKGYRKAIQMVSYAPHFLSIVVMCGMVIQFLDARSGIFNAILGVFGVPAKNYMAMPSAFPHIYIWSGWWQNVGYGAIIYIAALASVPADQHEAAIVDGANILQRIWHIDLPCVLPTYCVLLIMQCGRVLSSDFQKVLLLQNDLNKTTSEVISTFTYFIGLAQPSMPQYSYSTAIGLMTSLINVVMLLTVNKISKALTDNGLL